MERPARTISPFTLDRRRFLLAVAGGIGALAAGACAGSPGGESRSSTGRPTLRLQQGALGFPSPFASNGGPGYNQMSLLYDTLLWKDGSGELLPWLARSYRSSDDHLTHTFELRDGLAWSDGRPLTAQDVAFTFEYYKKLETLPPPVIIQPPQGIERVTANGRGVEIVLAKPSVTFPEQVAGALPIVPQHVWSGIEDPTEALDKKLLVGSGAYSLESYAGDGDPLLYTARDDYHLGTPFVKRIEWNAVEDGFAGMLSGAIDATSGSGLRPDTLAPFARNPAFGMITQQAATTTCLYWNLTKGGALDDPAFRRACALGIDRKDLVTRLAGGSGQPGNPGFLGPDNPFFTAVPQHDFDPAGANRLLDGAGYAPGPDGLRQAPGGAALSCELLASTEAAPLTELLRNALRPIGVELRPKLVTIGPQLFGTKLIGGFDMALLPYPGPSPSGPNGDPDVLRQLFASSSPPSLTGASGYANERFDDLAEKQRATFDRAERQAMVAEMQKILAEDLPVLSLFYPETVLLFRKSVLDQWYFTPGQFPTSENNKQYFITGRKSGTKIRGL